MEQKTNSTHFFLGANTAEGFTSFYDEFVRPEDGDFLWYIKGGPGNGKSTFMRSIAREAEKRGEPVEYAHCSGDPDSLDGIYLRERHIAYVDATSPHVQEPAEPGASGRYLDLSGFLRPGVAEKQEEIRRFFRLYREQYARSYQLLSAAALSAPEKTPGILREEARADVRARAGAFAERFLRADGSYPERHRFLSAYTCKGRVFFWETAQAMDRVCTLDNALGLGDVFLDEIRNHCQQKSVPCIICPDPLVPKRLAGILIPGCSLAILAVKKHGDYSEPVWKHLRLDAMAGSAALRVHREEFRECAAIQSGLLRRAECSLREAKRIHDILEDVYRPYLDTGGLEELLTQHKRKLFG